MAITVQRDGRMRPALRLAGDKRPAIEVGPVDATILATCLNAVREGVTPPVDEVRVMELFLATMFDKGREYERSLTAVS